jgi:hypothetical protein
MATDAATILGKGGPTKCENNEAGCKAGRSEGHCSSSLSFRLVRLTNVETSTSFLLRIFGTFVTGPL